MVTVSKSLIESIFEVANMQRWNDQIRPVELLELDKQAHKMIIAWLLGKFEESRRNFSWIEIIEGGFFEFLQRHIVTDLKPPIFNRIKKDRKNYRQLNEWVYRQLEPKIKPLGKRFCDRFRSYFATHEENINRRILNAAHFTATRWEFNIIERANPNGYEISEIREMLGAEQEKYYDLIGIAQLALYPKLRNFIDLCGQLRFQIRWSHIPRTPRTSVLGHMLSVAILSYLFSLQIGACERRRVNNYLTGLFHDLPEVLTRDIISPVKKSVKGLNRLIKQYETEQMERVVYQLIPEPWHEDLRSFTENEFRSSIVEKGKVVATHSDEINRRYNQDRYDPRDGELIRAVDNLTAYMEAHLSIKNGISNNQLTDAILRIRDQYTGAGAMVAGIDFSSIYADLKH